tara:strand:- start:1141 stop:1326 length:186 start_codon:yes stop_codon:yes gene_type:complete
MSTIKGFKSTLRSNPHCTNLPPEVWNDIMGWKIGDKIVLNPDVENNLITIRIERRGEDGDI